jgi:ribosomal protein S27AE
VLIARVAKKTRERGSTPPRWRCGDCHKSQMGRVPATALKVEVMMRPRQACSFCGERVVFFDMHHEQAWCASCGKGWRPA